MLVTRPASFAIGAVTALVLGSGTAYAATGGNFLLGKSNKAGATTSLTNTTGTALALTSKSGTAPLRVSNGVKVTNLNADRLDGLDSSSFALAAGNVKAYDFTGTPEDLDSNGVTDAIVASAACPSGTRRTGGGISDFTTSGYIITSGPDTNNSWTAVIGISESTTEDPTNVVGSIICYSPRTTPSAGYRVAGGVATHAPSAALLAKAANAVGRRS